MNDYSYVYKNFELVLDEPYDYYVFINYPKHDDIYDKDKTILFQMEPYVYDMSKNWGVKTWGEWKDPKGYLYVRKHIDHLNPAQWFFLSPSTIYYPRKDKIVIILSHKSIDSGHVNRIRFIQYVENTGIDIIDVYGYQNYHQLKSYRGPLPSDDKGLMQQYKYVLSIENNNEKNYATEKIWEPIIAYCLCFYDGCPNLVDYIDENAFIKINLMNPETTLRLIMQCIDNNEWDKRVGIISKEKEKIICKYNIFERIYETINYIV